MIIAPGATSNSIDVQVLDDAGLAVTGLVAATFPATYWSRGSNTASTQITLSDLSLITSAYSSGGVKERAGSAGYYRLDVPDAAFVTAGEVSVYGEASGKHIIAKPILIKTISAFNAASDTVTLAAATHTGAVIPTVTTLTNAPPDSNGVTTLLGRLTAARAGYLDVLNGLVSTIWANVADSAGVQTLLTRIGGALTITGGKVDINDKTNFALSSAANTAIANEVENQIIDETDSEKVLTAITNKIASVNPSLGSLTLAAIASQVRTELSPELADIVALEARLTSARALLLDKLNVSGTIANSDAAALYKADVSALALASQVSGLNNLNSTQVQSAAAAALSAAGVATGTNVTNARDAVLADTANIKGRLPLALVGGKMDAVAEVSTAGLATEAKQDTMIADIGAINIGAGSGAREVVITVTDGTSPLQRATVRMTEGAATYSLLTGADGKVTFALNDATYRMAISKTGYLHTPTDVVVNGDETITATMTLVAAPPDVTVPGTSVLYVDVIDDGAPQKGVPISAELTEAPPVLIDSSYEGRLKVTKLTDADGRATFICYPDMKYLIEGRNFELARTVTAPAVGTSANVADLPDAT
jgi:hypothetical protein